MIEVIYHSDKDRARLLEIQETNPTTMEEAAAHEAEKAEIHSRSKPLHECDIKECTELRTSVWERFSKLNNAGKYSMAQHFKQMLILIERKQQELFRQMALEEAAKKAEKGKKKEPTKEQKDEARSKAKARPQSGGSRWTTGIGDLD